MLLTFNTQVKKLLDQHRKCLSFRMQFEDVTLPPTLSFLLIYICFLYIFILILTEFFLFFLQIFSYLTNLLFFKSNCYITFHTPNSIKYIMLCSSHRSLMDCKAFAQVRSMPEVNFLCVPGRTHAHRLLSIFPNNTQMPEDR